MTPATPVCMARLASSYDRMSPFPEERTWGFRELHASRLGSSCSPAALTEAGKGAPGCVWPLMRGLEGRSELSGRGPTKQGHGAGRCHTLLDVLPVSQLGVALLPRAAMEL